VVLAVALVVSAWFGAQAQIASAYVAAHQGQTEKHTEENCPIPEPSSLTPLFGIDF
jgi:hypothetical protein